MGVTPSLRIRDVNRQPVNAQGEFVLYWMIANRRPHWNFSLQRAVELAAQFDRPLIVLEALRVGYPWASDRLHRFILQGMADNKVALRDRPVRYFPYVEPQPGAGAGLLEALAERACAVVTDDFPCFFLPRMIATAGRALPIRLEAIDSNGLLPLRAAGTVFARAYDFRRWLQKNLLPHLSELPRDDPFAGHRLRPAPPIAPAILARWPAASSEMLHADPATLAQLPIDHSVRPACFAGGLQAASQCLDNFLTVRLPRYATERNEPEADAASGLSPYLHFGHVSAHEVFVRLTEQEKWSPEALAPTASGARAGWWGLSDAAESFLDELITWRELGYNMCWQRDDYDTYESLPAWARKSLAEHAADPRPKVYAQDELEAAATDDPLWNAAQRQLVTEGRMHNYLRMLWGKKVLEWSHTPQEAVRVLIHLNNKYAVDGRNPNSYSGIFWVFGRYDRAWGPERPIFGKIRYMSSENTARKLRVRDYIERHTGRS